MNINYFFNEIIKSDVQIKCILVFENLSLKYVFQHTLKFISKYYTRKSPKLPTNKKKISSKTLQYVTLPRTYFKAVCTSCECLFIAIHINLLTNVLIFVSSFKLLFKKNARRTCCRQFVWMRKTIRKINNETVHCRNNSPCHLSAMTS